MTTIRLKLAVLFLMACAMGLGSLSHATCPGFRGLLGEEPGFERQWVVQGVASMNGASEATVDLVTVKVSVEAGDDSLTTAGKIADALVAELDPAFYEVAVCTFAESISVAVERLDGFINVFEPPEFPGHEIQEALAIDVAGTDDPPSSLESRMEIETSLRGNTVEFTIRLEDPSDFKLRVFDVFGRRLALLADTALEAGTHRFHWEVGGASRRVPAGVYFSTFVVGDEVAVRRVVLPGR